MYSIALYCTDSLRDRNKDVLFPNETHSTPIVGYQSFEVNTEAGVANVGAAFAPINASGKWTCTTQIFGNDVVADDVLYVFNADVWDLDYYQYAGNGNGWAYYTSDPNTGDPISSVVAGFELAKGDQTYFQPNDGATGLTVSGQVTDTTRSATWEMEAGTDVADIMNPYPKATTLADLESFAAADDVIYVFNENVWDLDYYQFSGTKGSWAYFTSDANTGDPISSVVTDTTTVVLPAGIGGYYQPNDTNGRTWTVTL